MSNAPIVIFKAHDIILAQIAATLNFNHDQAKQTGVFQAVLVAGGDVSGLVGADKKFALAVDDLGHAVDHDPVFAAVGFVRFVTLTFNSA